MNNRVWRFLAGLAAVLVVVALVLSIGALIAGRRTGRDLASVRDELAHVGLEIEASRDVLNPALVARFEDLSRRLDELSAEQTADAEQLSQRLEEAMPGPTEAAPASSASAEDVNALAQRMDEASANLETIRATLPGLADDVHALSERVGEVEAALHESERMAQSPSPSSAPLPVDPIDDTIRSAGGELVQTGSFVVLQAGTPIGHESFELYRSTDGYVLRASGVGERLQGVTAFTGALLTDEAARPRAYALRGSTRDGLLDVLVRARGDGIEVRAGAPDALHEETLPAGDVVVLDADVFSLFVGLESRRQTYNQSASLSVLVPQQASESPLSISKAVTVTIAAPAERLAAERRTVKAENGWEASYYVLDGRVIGVEVPGEGLFAYRRDRFADGFLVEPRSMQALALPLGVIETELPIVNNGVKLAGMLTYPAAGGETLPIVLLLPDLGPFDRNGNRPGLQTDLLKYLARRLAQAGIASYRLDMPGVGESGGTYESLTLSDLLGNARVAVFILRALPFADRAKIYALGVGVGGTIASLLASQGTVAGLITFGAPAYAPDLMALDELARRAAADGVSAEDVERRVALERSFYEYLREMEKPWDEISYAEVREALPWMSEEEFERRRESVPAALVRDLLAVDPTAVAGQTKTRALFIQGDKDFQVAVEQAGLLARAASDAGNGNVTLSVLIDVNHAGRPHREPASSGNQHLDRDIDGQLVSAIADWLSGDIEVERGGTGSPASAS